MITNKKQEEIKFKLINRDAEIAHLVILQNFLSVLVKAKAGYAIFLSLDTIDTLDWVISDKVKDLVIKLKIEVKEDVQSQ